jgi:hypothetical protein
MARRTLALLGALAILTTGLVSGCGVEKICRSGEVVVEGSQGGRRCEQPEPGDPTCPDDEILRKFDDASREPECIPNVYEDPTPTSS